LEIRKVIWSTDSKD